MRFLCESLNLDCTRYTQRSKQDSFIQTLLSHALPLPRVVY